MATMQIPNDIAQVLGYLREEEKVLAVKMGVTRVLEERRAGLSRKLATFKRRYGNFTRFERQLAALARKKNDFTLERDYFEWLNTLTALKELESALKNLRTKIS